MRNTPYLSEDTIYALATPLGGALAVVRLSGPRAFEILEKITQHQWTASEKTARKLFRRKLYTSDFGGFTLDDAMVVGLPGPNTYTGEDLCEIYIHGSAPVAEALFGQLAFLGARSAQPGEFSFRAVRNGKLDLSQAQAVADLIAASNQEAARLALEKMEGTQSRVLSALAENIRKLASMAELGIDFADQDVEELALPTLKQKAQEVRRQLKELSASFDRGSKIQDGIRVVFLGCPNAGKSSLFNALLGQERAIVSDIPGTTRDLVREKLTLRGKDIQVTLRLEDAAGVRNESQDPIEKEGIQRTLAATQRAEAVFWIVEANRGEPGWEEALSVWSVAQEPKEKTGAVLTKWDRVPPGERARVLEQFERRLQKLGIPLLGTISSTTGEGISELGLAMAEYCKRWVYRAPGELLLTRLDQLEAIQSAMECLERSETADSEDLFAADLRGALSALGPVIGETPTDDLLARIFSEFCIGK